MTLISDVGFVPRGVRSDVGEISFVESIERLGGRLAVIFLRFVVHETDVEIIFGGNLLQQRVAAIFEWSSGPVPIYGKRIDPHLFCFLNLLAQDRRIQGRISNVDVPR